MSGLAVGRSQQADGVLEWCGSGAVEWQGSETLELRKVLSETRSTGQTMCSSIEQPTNRRIDQSVTLVSDFHSHSTHVYRFEGTPYADRLYRLRVKVGDDYP